MTGMRVTVVAATILPGPAGGRLQHNARFAEVAGTSGGTHKRSTLQRRGSVDGQTLPTLIRPSLAVIGYVTYVDARLVDTTAEVTK